MSNPVDPVCILDAAVSKLASLALPSAATSSDARQILASMDEFKQQVSALKAAEKLQEQLTNPKAQLSDPAASGAHVGGLSHASSSRHAAGQEAVKSEPGHSQPDGMPFSDKDRQSGPEASTSGSATTAPLLQQAHQQGKRSPEDLFGGIFSVLDTLQRGEAGGLAVITGLGPETVRSHFTRLRNGVRAFLHRVQTKETRGGVRGSSAGKASIHRGGGYSSYAEADAEGDAEEVGGGGRSLILGREEKRVRQLAALRALQGPQGALRHRNAPAPASHIPGAPDALLSLGDPGGLLLAQMSVTSSWEVQSAMLRMVLATPTQHLMRMVSLRLLELLTKWLSEGESDGQVTFMLLLLRVVSHLPLPLPLLLTSPLLKSVTKLLKSKSVAVASAATTVLHHFATIADTQTGSSSVAHLFNGSSAAALTAAAGASGRFNRSEELSSGLPSTQVQQQQQEPRPVFKQPKAQTHFSTRPMSADDIRKAKEKQRRQAEYLARAGKGGPLEPPAKRQAVTGPAGGAPSATQGAAGGSTQDAAAPTQTPPAAAEASSAGASGHLTSATALPQGAAARKAAAAAAAAAVAVRGDGDVDVLPPEVLERLRKKRELRQWAQLQATKVSLQPALQEQVAKLLVSREEMTQALRAKRDRLRADQQRAAELAKQYMHTMQPRMAWCSVPPALSAECLEGVAFGEETTEGQARQLAVRSGAAPWPVWGDIPAGTGGRQPQQGEPSEAAAASEAPPRSSMREPPLPWSASDPAERMQQNDKAWEAGVRLPGFVVEPDLLHLQLFRTHRPTAAAAPAPAQLEQQQQRFGSVPSMQYNAEQQQAAGQVETLPAALVDLIAEPQKLVQVLRDQPGMLQSVSETLSRSREPGAQALLLQLQKIAGPQQQQQQQLQQQQPQQQQHRHWQAHGQEFQHGDPQQQLHWQPQQQQRERSCDEVWHDSSHQHWQQQQQHDQASNQQYPSARSHPSHRA